MMMSEALAILNGVAKIETWRRRAKMHYEALAARSLPMETSAMAPASARGTGGLSRGWPRSSSRRDGDTGE
jgi:hypothetical protein